MSQTILVTGGSGFLGRQIVAAAKEKGYDVFAPRSSEFNLETGEGVAEFFEQCEKMGKKIQKVVHSAAYYGGIGINQTDPAGLISRNTAMTLNLFNAIAKAGVKKVVVVGSACGYPGNIHDELVEKDFFKGACHESVEAYGFNKRVLLVFQRAFFKQYGIEGNHMVLTNLYGEHDVFHEERSHVVSALIKKVVDAHQTGGSVNAWGTGKPIREFVYVKDAANAIVEALEFKNDMEPVNVDGDEVTIRELLNTICDIVGFDKNSVNWDETKPDGVARKVLNGEKLRSLWPEYSPVPFKEGLEKTIQWYMDNKEEADKRR